MRDQVWGRIAAWLPAVTAGLLPVFWLPFAVDSFILPRAALAETGAGLLFAAGICTTHRRLGRFTWAALACAGAAILAAIFSTAPVPSLVGAYGRYESLPMRLAYLGLFWGTLRLAPPRGTPADEIGRWRGRIEVAFLAGCGIAAAEAVVQALLHLLSRPDGNLGQPDLLGALLAMTLPLLASRLCRSWRWTPLAVLLVVGLLLSTSRGAWLGALVGLGVWAARLAWDRSRRLAVAVAGTSVGIVTAGLAGFLLTPLRTLNQDTGAARLGVWQDGLRMIAARPLLGWGEDATGLRFGAFQSADWEPGDRFDRLHSMPLDLLATQGVLGLVACTVLFALIWRHVLPVRGAAPLAGALAAYFVWSLLNFDWAPATAPCWLLAAAALAGSQPAVREQVAAFPRRVLAIAAVVAGLLVGVPPLVADIASYAGDDQTAVALDPLQPAYHAAIATQPQLQQAANLGSADPRVWIALGDDEARAGHAAAAHRAYERALAIYPYDVAARQRLGR
ncbi:MAG: O-antigen ligase family protein [Candidatus Dormiibacterota bacterium]